MVEILSGGTAIGTTVSSGGTEIVASGGVDIGATLDGIGLLKVLSGGVATSDTVGSGDVLIVSAGGTAIDMTIDSGGTAIIAHGGILDVQVSATDFGTLTNSGIINVADGGTLTFAVPVISNAGVINFEGLSGGLGATLQLAIASGGTAMLTGHGTVSLNANGDNNISAFNSDVTLINVNNTISGAGVVRVGDNLAFINSGTVNATGDLTISTGASVITNAHSGTMEATRGGNLAIGSVNNSGSIEALDTVSSGGLAAVTVSGTVKNSGTIEALDTVFEGAADMTVSGTLNNSATVKVEATGEDDAFMELGGTINNSGIIEGLATTSTASIVLVVSGAVKNSGGTIEGSGSGAEVNLSGSVANSGGRISAAGDATLLINGATISGGVLQTSSNGVIETFGPPDTSGTVSGATIAAGSFVVASDDSELTFSGGTVGAGSTLEAERDCIVSVLGTVNNSGKLIANSGGGLTGFVVISGTIDNSPKGLILASHGTVDLDNATISGGTLAASDTNAVIVASGASNNLESTTIAGSSLVEVANGGSVALLGGTIGAGATVETLNGGFIDVKGPFKNSGTLFASGSGSQIEVDGFVSGGVFKVGDGVIDMTAANSESVLFQSDGTGGLEVGAGGSAYSGKVSGFGPPEGGNDTQFIDFATVNFAGATLSYTSAPSHTSGVLSVTDGAHVATVTLVGAYVTSDFQKVDDGGKLAITDPIDVYTSALTISKGQTIVASSSDVIAQSTVTDGGTLVALGSDIDVDGAVMITSTGQLYTNSAVSHINLDGTVSNGGLLLAFLGDITVRGVVINTSTGAIDAYAAGGIVDLELTVTNFGAINLAVDGVMFVQQSLTNANAINTSDTSHLIVGTGPSNPYLITNDGTISATGDSTITITAGQVSSGGIVNQGAITADGNSGISMTGDGELLNGNTIDANADGTVTVNMEVDNTGTIAANSNLPDPAAIYLNGAVTNTGVLEVTGVGAIYANTVIGGLAVLDGTGTVNNTTGAISGPIDTIELGASNTDVSFLLGFGLLELSVADQFTGGITGFTQGDGIALTGVTWSGGDTVTFTPNGNNNGGVLTVSSTSGVLAYLDLIGLDPNDGGTATPYADSNFYINKGANNDVIITDPIVTEQQSGNAPAAVGDGQILEINTPDFGQRRLHRFGRKVGV